MDRALLWQHLVESEQYITLGAKHICRQRELVAELERDGHNTALARELLTTFEQVQATHFANRDRLLKMLLESESAGG